MENLKIEAKNLDQKNEIINLFILLGYKEDSAYTYNNDDLMGIRVYADGDIQDVLDEDYNDNDHDNDHKEITLPELRALVSLHKNPINMDKVLSEVRSDALGLLKDKEYLRRNAGGTYSYVGTVHPDHVHDLLIEIPEGAETAILGSENNIYFWKSHFFTGGIHKNWINMETGYDANWYLNKCDGSRLLWQRQTHPEELPFLDDEPSLNDQYAEIENTRQEYKLKNDTSVDDYFDTLRSVERKPNQTTINAMNEADALFADAVNHPSHYTSDPSGIECIDAMEAMLTPEQFIGYLRGNAFKYQWRYEKKGGITDLEKAQWYLNKLISRVG